MSFSKQAELTAMAIVHIFETSKPFGEYGAYVVLPDGAGVTAGINQFTHKSGSLRAVIESYLALGGTVGASDFNRTLQILKSTTTKDLNTLAKDKAFEKAFKSAATTQKMQQAQIEVAKYKYFNKALAACDGSKFILTMSLAVIYDSINHGSFERIRDKVLLFRKDFDSDLSFEKAWIKSYCEARLYWLKNYTSKDKAKQAILRKTVYRPNFFLAQIKNSNWNLNPPMQVHGFNLQVRHLIVSEEENQVSTASEDVATSETAQSSENLPQTVENSVNPDDSENSDDSGKADNSNSFNSETVIQYVPKITQARNWLGGLTVTGFLGTVLAKLADAPQWFIFLIGIFAGMALLALFWLFVNYYKQIFALVGKVAQLNADPASTTITKLTGNKTEGVS